MATQMQNARYDRAMARLRSKFHGAPHVIKKMIQEQGLEQTKIGLGIRRDDKQFNEMLNNLLPKNTKKPAEKKDDAKPTKKRKGSEGKGKAAKKAE